MFSAEDLPRDRKFQEMRSAVYLVEGAAGCCYAEVRRSSPEQAATKTYVLSTLFTDNKARGGGLATELLTRLTALADKEAVVIALRPASFDQRGPSDGDLVRFYSHFGFQLHEKSGRDWMERLPKENGNG